MPDFCWRMSRQVIWIRSLQPEKIIENNRHGNVDSQAGNNQQQILQIQRNNPDGYQQDQYCQPRTEINFIQFLANILRGIVNCPFGAISDKSQIFQVIRAIQSGERVYAALAPAFVGQFGPKVTPGKLRAAMKKLGFADVFEVAIGADLCAAQEAEDFVNEVPEKLPFMATSCCPAWSVMAKKLFPDYASCISMALTPMTLTAYI